MSVHEADVIVVGAGPVGMTLAIDLAQRGVRVVLAEQRRHDEGPSVKCNHVAARTMEHYRRLGIVRSIRDAGLPADFPNDVVFRTTLTGIELTRIPIPCRAERYISKDGPDTWWPTPEPPHRINQLFFEPVLLAHVRSRENIELLHGTRVDSLSALDDAGPGVEAGAEDLASGERVTLRARYAVGCDGGSSIVRKHIGARLEGTPVVQQVQSTFIRAPQLASLLPGPRAWSYYAVNPRRCGTVFAIDGRETWLVHNHLNPGEEGFDAVDRDASIRTILGVGADFEYQIISKEDWVGRRLVADRLRAGRFFIAGDAAHLWVPYAGYGMNAGIADVIDLAWLLDARLKGWGGEAMLQAYQAERQPITEQVSHFAMEHAQKMIRARRTVDPRIEEPSPAGAAARAAAGHAAYELNVNQFCCAGLNFGYFYDASPIIVADGEAAPAYSMGAFEASTVPGCRVPHLWLEDGRSLYDAFGPGYTLLRSDRNIDVEPLLEQARRRQMPLALVELEMLSLPAAFKHALHLCRSDQHVAWRGHALPADSGALLDRLRGAITQPGGPAA